MLADFCRKAKRRHALRRQRDTSALAHRSACKRRLGQAKDPWCWGHRQSKKSLWLPRFQQGQKSGSGQSQPGRRKAHRPECHPETAACGGRAAGCQREKKGKGKAKPGMVRHGVCRWFRNINKYITKSARNAGKASRRNLKVGTAEAIASVFVAKNQGGTPATTLFRLKNN